MWVKRQILHWYDILVEEKYYVDIKVSGLKGADNTNSKRAIYYALTAQPPDKVSSEEVPFFASLKENEKPNDEDYYYLVVGKKEDPGSKYRAFLCSIKTLRKVMPNGSNMPFQCRWKECYEPVYREYEKSREFLLTSWSKSIASRIKQLKGGLPYHYPELFDKVVQQLEE